MSRKNLDTYTLLTKLVTSPERRWLEEEEEKNLQKEKLLEKKRLKEKLLEKNLPQEKKPLEEGEGKFYFFIFFYFNFFLNYFFLDFFFEGFFLAFFKDTFSASSK